MPVEGSMGIPFASKLGELTGYRFEATPFLACWEGWLARLE